MTISQSIGKPTAITSPLHPSHCLDSHRNAATPSHLHLNQRHDNHGNPQPTSLESWKPTTNVMTVTVMETHSHAIPPNAMTVIETKGNSIYSSTATAPLNITTHPTPLNITTQPYPPQHHHTALPHSTPPHSPTPLNITTQPYPNSTSRYSPTSLNITTQPNPTQHHYTHRLREMPRMTTALDTSVQAAWQACSLL